MDLRVKRDYSSKNYLFEQNKRNNVSFKNGFLTATLGNPLISGGFRYIDANKIMGPTVVDIVSMIGPRTFVDLTRNVYSGAETFIRETAGLLTNCLLPGFIGIAVVKLIAGKINNEFGNDASKILADNDTLEVLKNAWNTKGKEDKVQNYIENIFNNTVGLTENGWEKTISKGKSLYSKFSRLIKKEDSLSIPKEKLKELTDKFGIAIGARNKLKIEISEKSVITKLDDLIRDVYAVGKAFLKTEEVKGKTVKSLVEKLKGLAKTKTIAGLIIICSIASTVQVINRYFTKKKSGKKGFPGYCDFAQNKDQTNAVDKSNKFRLAKLIAAAIMAGLTYLAIGKPKNFTEFLKKAQFKGLFPTIDQVKIVYGSVIMGRILAAEDKNELRETTFRDYLGFFNYLVLGEFVSKGVAHLFDRKNKSLLNVEGKVPKGACVYEMVMHWLGKTHVKSHDEIIDNAFKQLGISRPNASKRPWWQSETGHMIEEIKRKAGQENKEIAENALKKLTRLNIAQLSGYAYACLMLGFAVPSINKIITDRARARQLARQKALCGCHANQQNLINTSYTGLSFVNNHVVSEGTKHL